MTKEQMDYAQKISKSNEIKEKIEAIEYEAWKGKNPRNRSGEIGIITIVGVVVIFGGISTITALNDAGLKELWWIGFYYILLGVCVICGASIMEAILWYMKEITANIQGLKTSIKEKVLFDMEEIAKDAKQE